MALSPLAGKPAPASMLMDTAALERAYYDHTPDLSDPTQRVAFGTSGHRGSPFAGNFTEAHILAITQAICEYRAANSISGPLFMGQDTHAASAPAQRTALEVLAANGVRRTFSEMMALRPRRSSRAPSWCTTAIHNGVRPTASSSPHRTIRPKMAALSTTHPKAARPTPPLPNGCKTAPTNCCAGATKT